MSGSPIDLIRSAFSGDATLRHVSAIAQHHRIQASPGYRAAARYVADRLDAAGLEVRTHSYPATADARFWATDSFLEWACDAATLELLDAAGSPRETLCDFAAVPISLIQRSIPVEGEFELVIVGGKGGKDPADYAGMDVTGKIVLTSEPAARVAELAVNRFGAAGVLFDGMQAGGRTELDLPDALQYTSFWWHGATPPNAFGFVISPRRGRSLRARLAGGEKLRVVAKIASRFYPGSFEVVDALLRGRESEGEVLLVSHLCHPMPGAHDNASGAAALLEVATTLAGLIAAGRLPRPQRGIRCIWVPEFTGSYAWLADHEAEVLAGRWIAGLNLDMVGANQCLTNGVWKIVGLPEAGAAFADHLLAWLWEPLLEGQRWEESIFEAGSDHYIMSDPAIDIPTPMVTQWPDKFYHTSADTVDKVSPESLRRSGALAATYAYWLANAGADDARRLGHWMMSRLAAAAGKRAARAAAAIGSAADEPARAAARRAFSRESRFRREAALAALGSLDRFAAGLGEDIAGWRADLSARIEAEERWVLHLEAGEPPVPAQEMTRNWREEAATLVPVRRLVGTTVISNLVQLQDEATQDAYHRLAESAGRSLHFAATLMQYWTDGRRTVADIAERVHLETGAPEDDVVLRLFKLMETFGLVELRPVA